MPGRDSEHDDRVTFADDSDLDATPKPRFAVYAGGDEDGDDTSRESEGSRNLDTEIRKAAAGKGSKPLTRSAAKAAANTNQEDIKRRESCSRSKKYHANSEQALEDGHHSLTRLASIALSPNDEDNEDASSQKSCQKSDESTGSNQETNKSISKRKLLSLNSQATTEAIPLEPETAYRRKVQSVGHNVRYRKTIPSIDHCRTHPDPLYGEEQDQGHSLEHSHVVDYEREAFLELPTTPSTDYGQLSLERRVDVISLPVTTSNPLQKYGRHTVISGRLPPNDPYAVAETQIGRRFISRRLSRCPPPTGDPNADFYQDYWFFMQEIGQADAKVPIIGGGPLNLFRFLREVLLVGGVENVARKRAFRIIGQQLDLPKTCTSAAYVLKQAYEKLLYHYEQKFVHDIDPIAPHRPVNLRRILRAHQEDQKGQDDSPHFGGTTSQQHNRDLQAPYQMPMPLPLPLPKQERPLEFLNAQMSESNVFEPPRNVYPPIAQQPMPAQIIQPIPIPQHSPEVWFTIPSAIKRPRPLDALSDIDTREEPMTRPRLAAPMSTDEFHEVVNLLASGIENNNDNSLRLYVDDCTPPTTSFSTPQRPSADARMGQRRYITDDFYTSGKIFTDIQRR